jgi:hypothetical protein
VRNSPEILASLFEDVLEKSGAAKVHPFTSMMKEEYIEETKTPRTPILICKTYTAIILKLPAFKPYVPHTILLENPKKGVISSMAVYGKRSNNTEVSTTSTDLSNTGIRYPMHSTVRIPNLAKNSKYSFAVAGYDLEENLANGIGATLSEVHASQPLPINLIYCYLCKISFQLEDYETSMKAAKSGCEYVLEKMRVKERLLDGDWNQLYSYRVNPKALSSISGIEMRASAECLLIWAFCSKYELDKLVSLQKNVNVRKEQQKEMLRICNLLLMGIELSVPCQAFELTRIIVIEMFNSLGEFFKMKTISKLLFQVLVKMNMAMSLIPKYYWDSELRKVSGKIGYQIIRLSLQIDEFFFSKRILYTEIKMPRRKWNLQAKVQMVEQVDVTKGKKAKPATTGKKPAEEEEEEKRLVPQFTRDIVERNSYQAFFEEFLLTIHEDYYNFADYFQDYWNDHLNSLVDKLSSDERVSQSRTELNRTIEFYSFFFDLANMKKKIDETSGKGERYLEYLSKYGKKLLEINWETDQAKDIKNQIQDFKANRKPDESVDLVDELIGLKIKCFEHNIDWNPSGVNSLKKEEEINQTGNTVAIEIFEAYFELQNKLISCMTADWKRFRYTHLWGSEISFLNAAALYAQYVQQRSAQRITSVINSCDIFELDIADTKSRISKQAKQGSVTVKEAESLALPVQDNHSFTNSSRSGPGKELVGEYNRNLDEQRELLAEELKLLDKILSFLSEAITKAMVCRAYRLVQNILVYTFNLISNEVLKPTDFLARESWKDIVLIIEAALRMIEDVKATKGFFDKDETNTFGGGKVDVGFFKVELDNQKVMTGLDPIEEKKSYWFENHKELDVEMVAHLIGFTVQVLMLREKWNVLINITKIFSNLTSHFYSSYILPFTLYAQGILLDGAIEKRQAKQDELKKRTDLYNHWVKTKKEKSRQLMLKNEKPTEQIKFEEDEAVLKKQIGMCTFKENSYKNDKDQAGNILAEIEKEAKQVIKVLRENQRQLAQYSQRDRRLNESLRTKMIGREDFTVGRKALQQEGVQLIKNFKSNLEKLKKKSDTFHSAVCLHDLANIYFNTGDVSSASLYWNESLDEIFEKLNSLKNYREVVLNSSATVEKVGIKELLIALILLAKLALFVYHKDTSQQRECILMACAIASDLLKISIEHPQNLRDLALYNLTSLGEEKIFSQVKFLNPSELLFYTNQLVHLGLEFEQYFKTLPLICILEFLAIHRCNSPYYSTRAKLLKSIALSNTGMINESIVNLLRVYNQKDLPCMNILKGSENLKLKQGTNHSFSSEYFYYNDITPYDDRNIVIVSKIMALKLPENLYFKMKVSNANTFNYAKTALIYNILKQENLEKLTYSHQRREFMEQNNAAIIDNIKRMIFEEKYFFVANAAQSTNESEGREAQDYAKAANYIVNNSNYSDSKDLYKKYADENHTFENQRKERISLIVMNYLLLARSLLSLNMITSGFVHLRNCLHNLMKLANEDFAVEFSEIPEVEEDDPKDKKKKDAKEKDKGKDVKKVDKNKKKDKEAEEEIDEEEFIKIGGKLRDKLEMAGKEATTQRGGQTHLWLVVKLEIASSLYFLRRWDEFQEFYEGLVEDCGRLNDKWYKRRAQELLARVLVLTGRKAEGGSLFQQTVKLGEASRDEDVHYAALVADYGEFLQMEKAFEKALEMYLAARAILKKGLRNYLYDFELLNLNQLSNGLKVCSELFENKYDIEQKLGSERIEKGGKGGKATEAKKKKEDKKGQPKDNQNLNSEIGTLFPMNQINSLKEIKLTMVGLDEHQHNNTSEYVCIYATEIELYAKLNQRIISLQLNLIQLGQNDPSMEQHTQNIKEKIGFMKGIMEENTYLMRRDFFIHGNMKAQHEYQQGKVVKFEAVFNFVLKQTQIINEHLRGEKTKEVSKILKFLPHKNFSRNKYIIKVPMFTKFLREVFLPMLDRSKESMLKTLAFLKGENIMQEFDFKLSDVLLDLADTNSMMAEYRPRLDYRYITNDDIRQYGVNLKVYLQDQQIYDKIESEKQTDQDLKNHLLWESSQYMRHSIAATRILEKLRMDYNKLGEDQKEELLDVSKMNKDVREEVREARRFVESVGGS